MHVHVHTLARAHHKHTRQMKPNRFLLLCKAPIAPPPSSTPAKKKITPKTTIKQNPTEERKCPKRVSELQALRRRISLERFLLNKMKRASVCEDQEKQGRKGKGGQEEGRREGEGGRGDMMRSRRRRSTRIMEQVIVVVVVVAVAAAAAAAAVPPYCQWTRASEYT